MKPIRSGDLNTRITIEAVLQPEDAITPLGEPTNEWGPFATVSANVDPIDRSGREYLQSAGIEADVTHKVTMRFLDGVTPKHRVNVAGRLLEIQGVQDPENRHRTMILYCREQV